MIPQVDLGSSILSGLKAGEAIKEIFDQRAEAERLQAEQQQYAQDVRAFMKDPTAQGAAALALKYPKQHEVIFEGMKALSADQQKAEDQHAAELFAAYEANRPEIAAEIFSKRVTGKINSGVASDIEQNALDLLQREPENAHQLIRGLATLGMTRNKDFIEAYTARRESERRDQMQPYVVEEQKAKASQAQSDATIKGEEAKAAPQLVTQKLERGAAEIGLTRAQTVQSIAAAKKLTIETQMAVAEAASGGDRTKQFEAERQLRREYDNGTKGYQDTMEAYRRMKAATNDGPGDLALIYSYMKMLDPGSVVREGEFATASNSAGLDARVRNIYNKVLNGERLTPGQRKTFLGQSGRLAEAAGRREKEIRTGLEVVVKNYRLNPENVFGSGIRPDPAPGGESDWKGSTNSGKSSGKSRTSGGATVSGW
jgi:hypothetical protein